MQQALLEAMVAANLQTLFPNVWNRPFCTFRCRVEATQHVRGFCVTYGTRIELSQIMSATVTVVLLSMTKGTPRRLRVLWMLIRVKKGRKCLLLGTQNEVFETCLEPGC